MPVVTGFGITGSGLCTDEAGGSTTGFFTLADALADNEADGAGVDEAGVDGGASAVTVALAVASVFAEGSGTTASVSLSGALWSFHHATAPPPPSKRTPAMIPTMSPVELLFGAAGGTYDICGVYAGIG